MRKRDVLAIGMAVADVIIKPVDTLPPNGGLNTVSTFFLTSGGVASTFSHDIARLGLNSGLVATIGDDLLGGMLLQSLIRDRVDVSLVRKTEELPTGGTVVLVDSRGERSFYHYPGASLKLIGPASVPIEGYRHIHLGGSPLMPEYDGEQGLRLLIEARNKGVSTSIDTVYSPEGNWEGTRSLLKFTDIALPSFNEALRLAETDSPIDQARYLIDRGVHIAVIKLGEQGALILEKGCAPLSIHPPAVEPIDNTGAGEAFCAGFICGYLKGWDIIRTADFAVSCGALATQSLGGPLMIDSIHDVELWMAKNPVTS